MQKELKAKIFEMKLNHFKETGELPSNVKHGCRTAALSYKCTCDKCTAYMRNYIEDRNERNKTSKSKYKEYIKTNGKLPDGLSHGASGYSLGCRCELCAKKGKREHGLYSAKIRDKIKQGETLDGLGLSHGMRGYSLGCRCEICKGRVLQRNLNNRNHFKKTGEFLSPKTKHGTHAAFQYGCRCDVCTGFYKKYRENSPRVWKLEDRR